MDKTSFEYYAPLPPIHDVTVSATAEWIFFWAHTAIALGGLVYAIVMCRKSRSSLPMMCMIGGGLTLFLEPLIEAQLHVWWPIHTLPDLFTVWGRSLPISLLPILIWYFGIGALLRLHMLEKHGVNSPLWKVYFIEVGMAYALEPIAIQLNMWHYYGEQGPRFFGYPMWWPMVGGACGCLAGTMLYKLKPYMTGPRELLGAILVPMAVAAVYWGASWPMLFVLNLEPAPYVIYGASLLSVVQALIVVWLCTIAVGRVPKGMHAPVAATT